MICGLLLAAGSSKRFGQNKLATRLPNDQALVLASAMSIRSIVDSLYVIVKPDDAELMNLLSKESISMISCSQSHLGMGHSIACGVTQTNDATGWVIALADMPFIKPSTIKSVVHELQLGALISVPTFRGRRGHPVGFSNKLYPDLVALHGDVGARSLLNKFESKVQEINCNDPGVLMDIDTPEDLEICSREFFTC